MARVLFSRQGAVQAETPAAGILEFGPPGCPYAGSDAARWPAQCGGHFEILNKVLKWGGRFETGSEQGADASEPLPDTVFDDKPSL